MSKTICPECNGESYIDEEPCLSCEAGFIDEIGPEDYILTEDQYITKGASNDLIYR